MTTFRTEYSGETNCFVIFDYFYYLDCTKCKFTDFSLSFPNFHFFPDLQKNSLTFPKSGISLTFPWPLDTLWDVDTDRQYFYKLNPNADFIQLPWIVSVIWVYLLVVQTKTWYHFMPKLCHNDLKETAKISLHMAHCNFLYRLFHEEQKYTNTIMH